MSSTNNQINDNVNEDNITDADMSVISMDTDNDDEVDISYKKVNTPKIIEPGSNLDKNELIDNNNNNNISKSESKLDENMLNNDEIQKLNKFLTEISLSKYLNIFLKEGFINMNDLMTLTFPDLIAMNIPRMHCKRLLSALNKLRNNNNNDNNGNNNGLTKSVMSTHNTPQIVIKSGRIPKSKNSSPLNINILLLGDMYVGKTSIRKRLETGSFVMTQATQGVELTCLYIENFRQRNEDLQITIWDPAGQERYASITKQFFRRAHGAAIVFDSNDNHSWKHVEYWLNELENNAPDDIEIMLLANKIDLLFNKNKDNNNDISNNNNIIDNNIDDDKKDDLIKHAINVAAEKRIPFYTTSAKSGEYIRQAFQDLISQILNNEYILKKIYKQRDGDLNNYYKNYENNEKNELNDNELVVINNNSNSKSKNSKLKKLKKKFSFKKKNYNEFDNDNNNNKTIKLNNNNSDNDNGITNKVCSAMPCAK